MEDDYRDSSQRPPQYTWLKTTGAVMAVLALLAVIWTLAETPSNHNLAIYPGSRERAAQPPRPASDTAPDDRSDRVVGTGGTLATGEGGDAGFEAIAPSFIQDLETITGNLDGTELIGRKVTLHVPVLQQHNLVTFWVGSPDNRLLVVLQRDVRDTADRQTSAAPDHGILSVHRGQQAAISGTIQRVPPAEERESWGLTTAQRREVESRRIYLRAESVRPSGHGE